MPAEIRQLETPAALAEAAAQAFDDALARRRDTGLPWCVALSGGRIAGPFYDALVARLRPDPERLRGVHFFFADERWVPLDHADSNYGLARERLFDPLAVPQSARHALVGGPNREFNAAQAQAELVRLAPSGPAGQPVLELAVLGMGEDGHVASLFPNAAPAVVESRAVYLPVEGTKPPPERITLTYAVLAVARRALVLVSGAGKTAALRESLAPAGRTPLARLLRLREKETTVLLTDVDWSPR